MLKPRSRPLAAKDFLIIRILKLAMMQALDEDSMPIPVVNWPAQPSMPLPPMAPSAQGQAQTPHFLSAQYDETTRIASLRAWLLSQPDIVRRIDTGVQLEFGESSRQLRHRALFLHILCIVGGLVFGILFGIGLALLLGLGR